VPSDELLLAPETPEEAALLAYLYVTREQQIHNQVEGKIRKGFSTRWWLAGGRISP
jgi:hypothetical protein